MGCGETCGACRRHVADRDRAACARRCGSSTSPSAEGRPRGSLSRFRRSGDLAVMRSRWSLSGVFRVQGSLSARSSARSAAGSRRSPCATGMPRTERVARLGHRAHGGRRPYDGSSPLEVAHGSATRAPEPLVKLCPSLAPSVVECIRSPWLAIPNSASYLRTPCGNRCRSCRCDSSVVKVMSSRASAKRYEIGDVSTTPATHPVPRVQRLTSRVPGRSCRGSAGLEARDGGVRRPWSAWHLLTFDLVRHATRSAAGEVALPFPSSGPSVGPANAANGQRPRCGASSGVSAQAARASGH